MSCYLKRAETNMPCSLTWHVYNNRKKIYILLQEYATEVSGKNSISRNLAIGFSSNLYYTPHFCCSLFYVEVASNIEH